ncbi:growth arrest-specific protein 1-like [Protopterus annectens]|uniref:growth arrest-specific protein 1-like n=1 Tax=Protopterus annectens TaxID=7888 RepID=UPI001CFBDBBD|nr:growth arrest-specific protein 1-like [Protopterus annectens]
MELLIKLLASMLWIAVVMKSERQHECWQVVLRCQHERECELAYSQYTAACESFVRGVRKQCPSHCIGALVRLNQTRHGPELERCDCGQDPQCHRIQQAIEPCLPRRHQTDSSELGCTEARQHCESEPNCQVALAAYLANCGQLFNGRQCGSSCRATIQALLSLPTGRLLDSCVCDGLERPFCEVVKANMGKLCFRGEPDQTTNSPTEHDDAYEDEDDSLQQQEVEGQGGIDSSASSTSTIATWHMTSWVSLGLLHGSFWVVFH